MNSPPATAVPSPVAQRTSLISHHIALSNLPSALTELTRMRLDNIPPNHATFAALLSSQNQPSHLTLSLHAYATKLGYGLHNITLGTALIGAYHRIRAQRDAYKVFDRMSVRNSVTWNVMVDGLLRNRNVEEAERVFREIPERDMSVVSWTGLVWGLVRVGRCGDALGVFREMQVSGVRPDYVCLLAVLAGCAGLGSVELGMWTHRLVIDLRLEGNLRVCNSLVDMYFRCGCVEFAKVVFEGMGRRKRNVVSWNSMINGFALNGFGKEALRFFDMMVQDGFRPDGVTFTGVLTACSHAGLVDEGLRYFEVMKRVYQIKPTIEHFGCIVDLYGRAGRLEDAIGVVMNMPMKPNEVVLGSLLSACASQGSVELAERLTEHIVRIDPVGDSKYVLLSNMYAALGKWDMASKTRRKMKALGIQKKPGLSTIEIGCTCHEFVAGDKNHVDTEEIYEMLEILSFELEIVCGNVLNSNPIVADISDDGYID